jgi:hypothetical protein
MDLNGFAYVNLDGEFVLFTDSSFSVSVNMSVGTFTTLYSTLVVADVDNDGHDEFIGLKMPTPTTVTPFVVDFNNDTFSEWSFSGVGGYLLGTGDFNGDTKLDIAILVDWSVSGDWVNTIDLSTGNVIGTFDVDGSLQEYSAIGRFSNAVEDQVVLSNNTHVWVVNGNGTCNLNMTHNQAIGLNELDYGGGLSDFIVLDNLGQLSLYQGTNLGLIYQTTVGPASGQLYATTGNFTGDAQQDIVVVSTISLSAKFLDGSNGTVFKETSGVNASTQTFATGYIDSDLFTDVVLPTETGNPCFLHGVDSEIAYIETTIDTFDSVRVFDLDGNGREDIFINSNEDLFILFSELDPPEVSMTPIDPIHPTVIDDYITVKIHVNEINTVESAELYLREQGTPGWTQPPREMETSDGGMTYLAFLVGLEAATYEYFVEVNDVYLNAGSAGNETHPLVFDVTGHRAWEHDKSETYQNLQSHQLIVNGNRSDGTPLIYTLELQPSGDLINLTKYYTNGSLVESFGINYTAGLDFRLTSGLVPMFRSKSTSYTETTLLSIIQPRPPCLIGDCH